jgi:hypothetical protein
VYDFMRMAKDTVVDIGSVAPGAIASFNVTIRGAVPDAGQCVMVGPPSTFSGLIVQSALVTADDTVTITVRNPTGGGIDPPAGLWGVRVMP